MAELLDSKVQAATAPTAAGGVELIQLCCRRTADGVWVVCGPEPLRELLLLTDPGASEDDPQAPLAAKTEAPLAALRDGAALPSSSQKLTLRQGNTLTMGSW